jgi:hypothetical protein
MLSLFHDKTEANPFADGHNFGFYTTAGKYGNATILCGFCGSFRID